MRHLALAFRPTALWGAVFLVVSGFQSTPLRAQLEGGFGESVEVRRVEVNVVVTDASGYRVHGLGRDDFELLVDGLPVEIREFAERPAAPDGPAEPAAPGASSFAASTPATPPAKAPDGEAAAATAFPEAAPTPRTTPLTWVVYVDSGLLAPGPKNDALRQLSQFLATHTQPQDRLLVASFDGKNLRFLTPLASMPHDRAAFDNAVVELLRQPGDAAGRRATARQLLLLMQQVVSSGGAGVPGDPGRQGGDAAALDVFLTELEFYIEQETRLSKLSLQALGQLVGLLAGVQDQRVAVVMVGEPLTARPGETMFDRARARLGTTPRTSEVMINRIQPRITSLVAEITDLFRRANAGRITFFTIDAGSGDPFGLTPAEETGLPGLDESYRADPASATLPLAALAAATGGRAFRAGPELGKHLGEVTNDLESYYSLTFEPAAAAAPGYRKIVVRLRPAGLLARYREGYSERGRREAGDGAAMTTLLTDSIANDLGVRVAITPGESKENRSAKTLTVRIELPLAGLVLFPDQGLHRGKVSFHFAVADEHREYRGLASKELEFTVPDDRVEEAKGEHVVYTIQLPASYRGWRLGVVVIDEIGGARAAVVQKVASPTG